MTFNNLMKFHSSLFLLSITLLLCACSPHPAAGVWKATEDNDYGITKLVVAFEGRADFVTRKLDNATWHCFWAVTGKQEASLDCTSSLNPEQEETFLLTVNNHGLAELRHKSQLVATFSRQDENPSPNK
jgi:outer membrane biogenesis lipoprotein LolB